MQLPRSVNEAPLDLLVVGDLNADLIMSGDVTPVFGQVEKFVDAGVLTLGGSAALTASAAARLGLRTAFSGTVGADELGRHMLQLLRDSGVDVSACQALDGVPTGITLVLQPGDGTGRAILTARGALAAEIDSTRVRTVQERVRHVHVGGYYLQESLPRLVPLMFERATHLGQSTSLDPNWDPNNQWDGLMHALVDCDVFLPNDAEMERLGTHSDWPALAHRDNKLVTVTKRGPDGAILRREASVLSISPPPTEPVDTIGAGDAFNAGIIYGVLAGWSDPDLLAMGVACGTLSTRCWGGLDGQASFQEADELRAALVRKLPKSP